MGDKDKIIKELNKDLKNSKATIINNDNRKVVINNYILDKSIKSITIDTMKEHTNKLNLNHILEGGSGIGKFVIDNILPSSSIVCNDYHRQTCSYQVEKEDFKEMKKLIGIKADFNNAAAGFKAEFEPSFKEYICSHTLMDNLILE